MNIQQTTTMDELEKKFSSFLTESEKTTSSITKDIQMDELNEIGDEIVKARQYVLNI